MIQKCTFMLAGFLFAFTTSCTGHDPHAINYPSPLKFTYDQSLSSGEFIARVDKEDITVSQLFSPSPALTELEERINKIVMQHAYQHAVAAKKDGPVVLTFGFEEPKDAMKTLFKGKVDKEVTIKFDPSAKHGAADINGQVLTREQVAAEDLLLAKLMAESYHQKMQGLEGIISRRKILEASKDAKVTMEDYIQKNVIKGAGEVSEQDVKDYAAKNNITEKELTEEMTAQLKDVIRGRRRDQLIVEYVGKNLLKSPIHVGFKETNVMMPTPKVDAFAPSKGTGPIDITVLTQFNCKECRDVEQKMYEVVADHPKAYHLNFVFNIPDNNPEERMIAEAALCMKKQKDEYFWNFLTALSKSKGGALEEDLNNTAKSMGAKFEDFRSCFLAREFKDAVESHVQQAKAMGFYRSPVVLIDGRVYEPPVSAQALVEDAQELKAEKGLGFNLFYKIKKMFKGT